MNTAVINIKVEPDFKYELQKVAADLGMGVSGFVKATLKEALKKKTVTLSMPKEELTPYAKKVLAQALLDYKKGDYSPTFTNAKDAIKWLNDPNKKYQRNLQ